MQKTITQLEESGDLFSAIIDKLNTNRYYDTIAALCEAANDSRHIPMGELTVDVFAEVMASALEGAREAGIASVR